LIISKLWISIYQFFKKKRVISFFFFLIGIPCIILGYFAFRGLLNDQAVFEKHQREELIITGNNIVSETNQYLSSIEDEVFFKLSQNTLQDKSFLFNKIFKNHQLVIGSFIYGRNSNHFEISSQYPQFSKSFNLIRNDIKPDVTNLLSRGWKFEFIQKDYDRSIQFYKSILERSSSSQIKASIK